MQEFPIGSKFMCDQHTKTSSAVCAVFQHVWSLHLVSYSVCNEKLEKLFSTRIEVRLTALLRYHVHTRAGH